MCTTPLEFRYTSVFFHQAICDMWKHIFAHYSISTCGKATECCVLVLPLNLHNISYGFWPWPTFQIHGGQTSKIYIMWYNFATIAYICIKFSHWINLLLDLSMDVRPSVSRSIRKLHLLLDRSTDQVETFSCVGYSSTNVHKILRSNSRLFPPFLPVTP
jgi:hypothetical protein